MRLGTALVLAGLVLAVVFLGFLKTIGILLAAFATLVLLLFAAMLVGAWLLKRRMRRKLAELQGVVQEAARQQAERRRMDEVRRDAIDTEFEPHGRK